MFHAHMLLTLTFVLSRSLGPQGRASGRIFLVCNIFSNRVGRHYIQILRNSWDFAKNGARQNRNQEDREQRAQAGHLLQAPRRSDEEGPRTFSLVRCRGGSHCFLQPRKALRTWHQQQKREQKMKQETNLLKQQIDQLKLTNRYLMGEGLGSVSFEELNQLESRLQRGINQVRAKKHELMLDEIRALQSKEHTLRMNNMMLQEKLEECTNGKRLSSLLTHGFTALLPSQHVPSVYDLSNQSLSSNVEM